MNPIQYTLGPQPLSRKAGGLSALPDHAEADSSARDACRARAVDVDCTIGRVYNQVSLWLDQFSPAIPGEALTSEIQKEDEFHQAPRPSLVLHLSILLLAMFVGGGLYFGYVFVHTATSVLSATLALDWAPLPSPPLGAVASLPEDRPADAGPKPTVKPSDKTAPPASGERVNILLLGLDQRDDERANNVPSRSDTVILATIDPVTHSAAMLSMPRDLWVAIPGYRDNKITVAHFLGEMDKLPGGGPELAKKTVELNLGVPVHYFVRVNFRGFERMIDTLGGVDIEVPKYIVDYEYPTEDYGYMTVEFVPGMQHMNGVRALQYARTRHYDSDFYRNKRQMQVIAAARSKAVGLDILPRLPTLIGTIQSSVDTDIPVTAWPGMVRMISELDSHKLAMLSIESDMVSELYPGATDLVPRRDEVRKLVAAMMGDPTLLAEKAKIQVLNGSKRDGLGTKVANYMDANGFSVAKVDKAPNQDFPHTMIVDHTNAKTATREALVKLLNVAASEIRADPTSEEYDLTVIVGADTPDPPGQ